MKLVNDLVDSVPHRLPAVTDSAGDIQVIDPVNKGILQDSEDSAQPFWHFKWPDRESVKSIGVVIQNGYNLALGRYFPGGADADPPNEYSCRIYSVAVPDG